MSVTIPESTLEQVEEARETLREHNHRYYVLDTPSSPMVSTTACFASFRT